MKKNRRQFGELVMISLCYVEVGWGTDGNEDIGLVVHVALVRKSALIKYRCAKQRQPSNTQRQKLQKAQFDLRLGAGVGG